MYNAKTCLICHSGESMENALRACCKGIKIGKILIHRDGDNGKQVGIHKFVLLLNAQVQWTPFVNAWSKIYISFNTG